MESNNGRSGLLAAMLAIVVKIEVIRRLPKPRDPPDAASV